jgi:hypothetical protein
MNPIGPPVLIVCSMPRMRSVIKNLIADIFREFTKILFTFGCLNSILLSSFGLMLEQTSSFVFTNFTSEDSEELSLEISYFTCLG